MSETLKLLRKIRKAIIAILEHYRVIKRYLYRKYKKHGVYVSKYTTLRYLHKLSFQSRVPKFKPFMIVKQKMERQKWDKKGPFHYFTNFIMNDWKKSIL